MDKQTLPFVSRYAKWLLVLLIALILLALTQAVRFLWNKSKTADVFLLVPAGAVAVVDIPDAANWWKQADSTYLWQGLKETPYFAQLQQRLEQLATLPGQGREIMAYLGDKRIYASIHVMGKADIGYLFYVPMPTDGPPPAQPVIDQWVKQGKYSTEARQYQGQTIQEISDRATGEVFSYLFHKNYFIASFSPFLLEDAIRNFSALNRDNFYTLNRAALAKLETGDRPYTYVNIRKMPEFLSAFSGDDLAGVGQWAKSLAAETDLRRGSLVLRGTVLPGEDDSPTDWVNILAGQAPSPHRPLLQYVPEQTALMLRIGFSDGPKLLKAWQAHRADVGGEPLTSSAESLEEEFNFSATDLFGETNGEVALLIMENVDKNVIDRVVLVGLKTRAKVEKWVNSLAQNAANLKKDTVVHEVYGKLNIAQVDVPELPSKLYGPSFAGFPRSFVGFLGDYLVIGNSARAVKNWLDQVENEQVWGKSVKNGEFMSLFGAESNLLMVASQVRYWKQLQTQLLPDRQATAVAHQRQFLRLEWLGLQVSGQGNKFDAVLALKHRRLRPATGRGSAALAKYATKLAAPVNTRPWIFRSHVDKSWETLVQDNQNNLSLFSSEGKRLWSTPLGGRIAGNIHQIDIYNNGKFQFLFCTSGGIYVVDRLGRFVTGFPKAFSWQAPLRQLSVIDYDNSKNYRFAVADELGNIYLFDKSGNILPGWSPRPQLNQLIMPPFHIRSGLKDCILAVQQDGGMYAIRRNGTNYQGFPVKFSETIASPVYLQEGAGMENTVLQLLTNKGDLVSLNLLGQVTGREQFGPDGVFQLCTDEQNHQGWVVARQMEDWLLFYAQGGKLLFKKKMAASSPKVIQYFNFGTNLELVAVTDPKTKLLQLIYLNGEELLPNPLPSDREVSLRYLDTEEAFEVYTTAGNTVCKWQVARN